MTSSGNIVLSINWTFLMSAPGLRLIKPTSISSGLRSGNKFMNVESLAMTLPSATKEVPRVKTPPTWILRLLSSVSRVDCLLKIFAISPYSGREAWSNNT